MAILLVKCDFSYSCAASDKISTDLRARAVSLWQLSYLYLLPHPNPQPHFTGPTKSRPEPSGRNCPDAARVVPTLPVIELLNVQKGINHTQLHAH